MAGARKADCCECNQKVAKNAKALKCAFCREWFHVTCIGLEEEDYLFMRGRQSLGFRWFCEACVPEVDDILLEERSASTLEKKLVEGVSVMITDAIGGLAEKVKALESKIDVSSATTSSPPLQPETFANILKAALDDSNVDQRKTPDSGIKINAFGQSRTVHEQQVLVIKPKTGREVDAEKIARATNNIAGSLKSVPVRGLRETKLGSIVVKFPTKEAKDEATNLMTEYFDDSSEFTVSEPKKMMPKITLTGISATFADSEIIESIREKNKNIDELVERGFSLSLLFSKIKNDNKIAVLKMSPEIRLAIEKANRYVYVGLNRCRAYDRFWVTQCYHCQNFGHISTRCPQKDKDPVCLFCAGNHRSSTCTRKSTPKCANCSSHETFRGSSNHSATSSDCPIMSSQREKVIENTNLVASKNL